MKFSIFVGAGELCIRPTLPFKDRKEFIKTFTFVMPDFQRTNKHKQFGWTGEVCLFRRGQELPVGCLYRAQHTLKKLGHTYDTIFANKVELKGKIEVDDLTLDKFQHDAVERALKYRYGIIVAPVRAGKTAISAAIIRAVGHYPAWVVTERKDLVLQTQADIARHLSCPVGIYSEGVYRPQNITVASYAALRAAFIDETEKKLKDASKVKRNEDVKKSWGVAKVIILDECHHAATRNVEKILLKCSSAAFRIGLTATPQHGNTPALLFESKVGCIISKIQYSTLIEKGRLAKPIVILYNMPYAWYSTYLPTYDDVTVANLIENNMRNMFIRDVVSKLKEKRKTCFIQVSRIEHGKMLNDMIPGSIFVRGSMGGASRKEIYKELNEKTIHCVIGTVGKEGLNIPSLDAVINAEGSKSTVANKQKMRSLTACKEKSFGLIIDFIDKGRYLLRHSKARRNMYESLSGFTIKIRQVPKNYFPLQGETRWRQE